MQKEYKIYTKTGDDGTTGLVGGNRVKKYNLRLEAYGTIDELNAVIGVLQSFDIPESDRKLLIHIQNKLFNIGSRLASDEKGDVITAGLAITEEHIRFLENAMDDIEKIVPPLTDFILPGGEITVAQCHVARTVCRRAERRIVEFSETKPVQPEIIKYINRLSDYFFMLSRKLSFENNCPENKWNKD